MSCSTVGVRLRTLAAVSAALVAAGLAGTATANAAAAPGVLTGTVTGADGAPLADVTVAFVVPNVVGGGQAVDRSTRTNSAGRYTFSGGSFANDTLLQFDAAAATGGTSATGYSDLCFGGSAPLCWVGGGRAVTVADGARRTLDVTLRRAGILTGRAVDAAGRGVGRMPVTVWAGAVDFAPDAFTGPVTSVLTDVNGNYRLRESAYGYTAVCFGQPGTVSSGTTPRSPFGYAGACTPNRAVVAPGGTTVRNVTLDRGAALGGTVVSAVTGTPVAGADVSVHGGTGPDAGLPTASGRSAADGTFVVYGVAPGSAGWCVSASGFDGRCSSSDVTFAPGVVTGLGTVTLTRSS